MLSRLSARVTWSWNHVYYWRAFSEAPTMIVPGGKLYDPPQLLNVVRRVTAVRSSLSLPYQEVPSSDELSAWRSVLVAKDIEETLEVGGEDLHKAPTWVIMYLLSTKVQSPLQAMDAVSLMLQHFPEAEPSIRPSLLVLTARFLAKRQISPPMANLVKAFLMLPLARPSAHFNLLLRALSHFRPTPALAKLTAQLLDAMHARQLRLHSRTYRALLSNKLVTLELTKLLQARMVSEGFRPNASHLEAYLRVFAKHGAVRSASRYLNAIRQLRLSRGEIAPYGIALTSEGAQAVTDSNSANMRWNTELLRSFGRNPGSAFHYLRGLVGEETAEPPSVPRRQRKEHRFPTVSSRLSTMSLRKRDSPVNWKVGLHPSDWTTLLHSVALDPHTDSKELLRLFKRSKETTRFVPTIATFTVVIRGLTKKGDYSSAKRVWDGLYMSKARIKRIDTKALTVGMDVLVGAGMPQKALATLIESSGLLRAEPADSVLLHHRNYDRYSWRVKVDTLLVNALLNSLQKHGRPDAVFPLWDAFTPLFGVYPNAETLTILLRAAREAARLDHTLRGIIAHIGIHNPFKAKQHSPDLTSQSRAQIVESIVNLLGADDTEAGESGGTNRSGRTSIWNGQPAAPRALELFDSIVLNNYPHLRDIQVPARAVWSDDAQTAQPVRDFVRSFGIGAAEPKPNAVQDTNVLFLRGPSFKLDRPPATTLKQLDGHAIIPLYPQIAPNEKTFSAYLALLGSQRRASEIPRMLAWMRALDLVPTKGTLCRALALWGEVSLRGPLLERFESTSEYERLVHWLGAWLGADRMPTDSQMARTFTMLQKERDRY